MNPTSLTHILFRTENQKNASLLWTAFVLVLYILVPELSIGQQYALTGKVVNEVGEPLEFSTVLLIKDTTFQAQAHCDSLGDFSITNLAPGTYSLRIKYFTLSQDFELEINGSVEREFKISTIQELGDVTVTIDKPILVRKIDRLVFYVENSISAFGGSAIDALQVTPGVTVINDLVGMVGKSSASVMINERLIPLSGSNLTDFLKTVSSNDILRIEVITAPSSKYDVQGNGGLINIVLKKGARNAWSNTIHSSFIRTDNYPSLNIGNSFQLNKNKISLLFSLDGKIGDKAKIERNSIFYPNEVWNSNFRRKLSENFMAGKFLFDYQISKTALVGIQYFASYKQPKQSDTYKANILSNLSDTLNEEVVSEGATDEHINYHSLNVHFNKEIDTLGKEVSVDFDYFYFDSNKDRTFNTKFSNAQGQQYSYYNANNLGDQFINNFSGKVDFIHPTKFMDLSYGLKASIISTKNELKLYNLSNGTPELDSLQSDVFEYSEKTGAAYVNASKSFGKKWQVQLGVRTEYTETKGVSVSYNETNKYRYLIPFPSMYLTYTKSQDNIFTLNYNKRINRPSFWELNPFKWYINEISYAEGNPFLRPSYTNNIEFSHIYKQKLMSTFFATLETNNFGQVPYVDTITLQQIYTRKNFYNLNTYGIYESYFFNKFHWWQSQNVAYFFYTESKIKNLNFPIISQNGFGYYLSTSNTFTLNKKKTFFAELNVWYQSSMKTLIYDIGQTYSVNIGVKYLLFDKKMKLAFNVNDLLKTSFSTAITTSNNVRQDYNSYADNRYVKFSASYTFGNQKISKREHQIGNEDEKYRTR